MCCNGFLTLPIFKYETEMLADPQTPVDRTVVLVHSTVLHWTQSIC